MSESVVRYMTAEDICDVSQIENLCFAIPWSKNAFLLEIAENRCARYFVATKGQRCIAYGGMWLMLDEAHITNIAVHPDFRGLGLGKEILTALINEAKSNGSDKITLEVKVSNSVAINLYQGMGFISAGTRKGYYADTNEDALIMWKYFD